MNLDEKTVVLLGYSLLAVLSLKLARYLCYIVRVYFLTRLGFRKTLKDYGEWAVVTGATDGIGKEYARQLAEAGLNIVLISRTNSKLEKVANEIEEAYSVKTKIIVFDFTNQDGYDVIEIGLKGLEIGILINNVGINYGNIAPFHNCDIQRSVNIVNANVLSDVRMTRMVLPEMMSRKKGAIVHISSGSIFINVEDFNVYPATKMFMQKFFRDLQLETSGVIDHQLLTPMYVESNSSKQKAQFTIPTAKEYVTSAIRTIGVTNESRGYLSHELLYLVMINFPFLLRPIYTIIRYTLLKGQ